MPEKNPSFEGVSRNQAADQDTLGATRERNAKMLNDPHLAIQSPDTAVTAKAKVLAKSHALCDAFGLTMFQITAMELEVDFISQFEPLTDTFLLIVPKMGLEAVCGTAPNHWKRT